MRITAEDLTVRYPGASRPALDAVSLDVPAGCLFSVLGPNGSGKSSLVRALLGVLPLASGVARLEGRRVDEWKRVELARSVGVVSQSESIAFPLTVSDFVGMGRYPHVGPLSVETEKDRAAVRAALAACDIEPLALRDVTTLSGGEFQRARIARALAQEPSALVLDEPTSSLDIRHQMAILELLRRSADDGMTVLLVTHSLDLAAQFSDRMLLLAEGRVAQQGTPSEVLREEVLSDVYGWPLSVSTDPDSGAPRVAPVRRPPSWVPGSSRRDLPQ
ncbi:MAG: ABC transporter ATP-binding protein [Gemmatimonadetes bacterium]|nr:ABC transporter ATP-binding protein [Gemmatimonadota bacterium]NNL30600.1 ABC transporter ATP-binding protein [Gemmatimonadota bacterium]